MSRNVSVCKMDVFATVSACYKAFVFKFVSGFEGHNCENNVDDCPGHKCMNGGICVDGVNTYNCQCPPEWTGIALQINFKYRYTCHVHRKYVQTHISPTH